jgi:hypothetical protein
MIDDEKGVLCDVCGRPATARSEDRDLCGLHYLQALEGKIELLEEQAKQLKSERKRRSQALLNRAKAKVELSKDGPVCTYCGVPASRHAFASDGPWKVHGHTFYGDCYARYASSQVSALEEEKREKKRLKLNSHLRG